MIALLAALMTAPTPNVILDPRDKVTYRVVTLGRQRWFAENLRFKTPGSRCYGDDEANCAKDGRLYQLPDAQKSCPMGWRVPTDADWQRLEQWLGMSEEEANKSERRGARLGTRLKPEGDTGFNTQYSGWIDPPPEELSKERGRNAAYWTSTETTQNGFLQAWHRDVNIPNDGIWRSPVRPIYWLAVRCMQDIA